MKNSALEGTLFVKLKNKDQGHNFFVPEIGGCEFPMVSIQKFR